MPHVAGVVLVGTAGMDDMHKLPAELDAHWRKLSALVAADPSLGKEIPLAEDHPAVRHPAVEQSRGR